MRYSVSAFIFLNANAAFAHSGEHLHPHDAGSWLAMALAACTVAGTMALAYTRRRK